MAAALSATQRIAAELARVLSLTVLALILYLAVSPWGGFGFEGQNVFNLHPPLMILALVALPAQSALLYRSSPLKSHNSNKRLHAAMHTASLVIALLGLLAVLKSHRDLKLRDFYSLHSWVGLTTLMLFIGNYTAGVLAFLWPGALPSARQMLRPYHAHLGVAILVAALATAMLGIQEKSTFRTALDGIDKSGSELMITNAAGLLLLFQILALLYAFFSVRGSSDGQQRGATDAEEALLLNSEESHAYA